MGKGDSSIKIIDARRRRPPAYDPKRHPVMILALCLLGKTDKEIADTLQINEGILNDWKAKYAEINESIKGGKEKYDAEVEDSLRKRAMGFETTDVVTEYKIVGGQPVPTGVKKVKRYVEPNPTAMIFWLKNRQRRKWSDRQTQEHVFEGEVSKMPLADLIKLCQDPKPAADIGGQNAG